MSDFGGADSASLEQGQQGQQEQAPQFSELGSGFLNNVAPQDREVVSRYLKDWDAGVTRRFQSVHDEYKGKLAPYEGIGLNPGELTQAAGIYQLLADDPRRLYNHLKQVVEEMDAEEQQQAAAQGQLYGGLPQPFVQEWNGVKETLATIAEFVNSQKQTSERERQKTEVQNFVKALHEQHGAFDDDFVMSKIAAGHQPESAIQSYNQFVQQIVGQRPVHQALPPIMGGAGSVPTQRIDPSQLSKTDVQNMVAQLLQDAAQA